jgi:(p)ppGpp synthase/HD superfamily hydrolase
MNKRKLYFSTADIDWEDDSSIEAWASSVWEIMNNQREKQMTVKLTDKYSEAFKYANEHHAEQTRKGKSIPYISHLLAVSALVLEAGGDEDQAIGGLLHDVAEDHGGEARLAEVAKQFGPRVEAIVRGCSDSITDDPEKKADWIIRKRDYLSHLRSASQDILIVSASDKLHNSRDTLADIKRDGIDTLNRFNVEPEGTIAYYTSLWLILSEAGAPAFLTDQLQDVAQQMVNALYPTEGFNITDPETQRRITDMLLA